MSYHPCVSGCGLYLAPQDGHDCCLTGIQQAEEAFVDGSCSSCGDMTISELRNRLLAPGTALRPVETDVIWWLCWGLPQVEFLTPQVLRSRQGCCWIGLGPLQSKVHHPFPSVLPLMTRCRSLHRRALSLSGDDTSAALPLSGVVALSESDPEMTAMLSRAAENVWLVWNSPPLPNPLRLNEWFLGAILPWSAWGAYMIMEGIFHCPKKILWLHPSHHLNGGAALVYTGITSVEQSVAMQLSPTAATTLGWALSPLTGL